MSEMLDKTIEQVKQLPKDRQDAIAAFILEEIEDEAHWDAAFAKSPEVLERLAEQAEAEDQKGQTEELDLDAL
jgi:diaminopimelate decarboxylase